MNLYKLIAQTGISCTLPDREITGITEHIENVTDGYIFVAVKGASFDGNSFIGEALLKGASCVFSEEDSENPLVVKTDDARYTLAMLCSAFYGHPWKKLKTVGITGTNGKTTVAEYLSYILNCSGYKCGVIGTLGVRCEGYSFDTGYTTPSPEILYRELDSLVKNGCIYCIAEVSSQALEQKRVAPIVFDTAVFTNIGTDHLDRHGTFQNYISAKSLLFSQSEKAVINADDINADQMAEKCRGTVYTFSAKDRFSDFSAKDIRYSQDGISCIFFDKKNIIPLFFDGAGEYSVYNALAAFSAAEVLGLSPYSFPEIAKNLPPVKGRLSRLEKDGIRVYIDFAHTPEALQAVLQALKRITSGRLYCIFGCGGNRDKSKRPLMGEVAARYADTVIITSDNPRFENPAEISADIRRGIRNKRNIITENDRQKAIELALSKAKPGDAVLVAGKGHEEYQLICGKKYSFSDEMTVKNILGLD